MDDCGSLVGPVSGHKASAVVWSLSRPHRLAMGAAAMLSALLALGAGGASAWAGDDAKRSGGAGGASTGDDLNQLQHYYDSVSKHVPGGLPQGNGLRAAVEQARQKAAEQLGVREDGGASAGGKRSHPTFASAASALARSAFGTRTETGERDPFSLTPQLERMAQSGNGQNPNFVPGFDPEDKLPKMRLRGLLKKDNQAIALLDIEGVGIHVVREGDAVGLHQLGVNNVIKIVKFDELSLVVEAGSFGQVFIVR